MSSALLPSWPYPRWIAHRGAGLFAPENTLAAFRLGAQHGYRMFECDAKLSADEVVFLLHDDRLDRTSSGAGVAGDWLWRDLSRLDAGAWHSLAFAGEPLCTLDAVAQFCIAHQYALNIEIKPTPGVEFRTGVCVATEVRRLWAGQTLQPLLTSFKEDALAGAKSVAPDLRRGLLLSDWTSDSLTVAERLSCVALVCNQHLWDAPRVQAAKALGLKTLSYTVNDPQIAQHLQALGTDGIITDRVDLFSPESSWTA
jgi:glycerophosphoryl diester phosphodiesterase